MEILENPTSFRPEPKPTETSEEYFEIHFGKTIFSYSQPSNLAFAYKSKEGKTALCCKHKATIQSSK